MIGLITALPASRWQRLSAKHWRYLPTGQLVHMTDTGWWKTYTPGQPSRLTDPKYTSRFRAMAAIDQRIGERAA